MKSGYGLFRIARGDAHANWALDGIKYLDSPEKISGIDEKEVVRGPDSKRTFLHLSNGGTMHQPAVYKELQYK